MLSDRNPDDSDYKVADATLALLESAVADTVLMGTTDDNFLSTAALFSIAISLRRIADEMARGDMGIPVELRP